MDDQQKTVAERAFELWEEQGRPEGQDYQNWLQAERELLGESSEPLGDENAESAGEGTPPHGADLRTSG